jgi:hypothetical protein
MRARGKKTAMRIVIGPFHRAEFLLDRKLFSGFEQQDLQSMTGKDVSGHSSRCAGTDNDRVVGLCEIHLRFRHGRVSRKLMDANFAARNCRTPIMPKAATNMFSKIDIQE